jgi:hypothetical protein
MVARRQVERLPEVRLGRCDIQLQRPVAGQLQGADAGLEQLALKVAVPCCPGQIQGGDVVVREDLGGRTA